MTTTYHYAVEVFGGIEPTVHGYYPTADARDEGARALHRDNDPENDAVFAMDITTTDGPPIIELYSYSGAFFDETDEQAAP